MFKSGDSGARGGDGSANASGEGSANASSAWLHHLLVTIVVVAVGVAWLPIADTSPKSVRGFGEQVRSLTVQGWGFFTKSPRDPSVTPYTLQHGHWVDAGRGPNAIPKYAFGFDRSSRLTEFDVDLVRESLDEGAWTDCKGQEVEDCADNASATAVTVTGYDLRLCGDVLLASTEPQPWAYRSQYEPSPDSVAVLQVECREET